MKKILLIATLALTCVACEEQGKGMNADNSGKNVRDRDSMAKTPMNQGESEADRTTTQRIRQAIMADTSLSTNAKNIKIITANGVVTLRGPVGSTSEKDAIAKKVKDLAGVNRVDNQLEITDNNS